MLLPRWASVNDLVQIKFCSIIHLLSQYLLAQSHRQKHQMNVHNLLKVNNKETRTKSVTWLCISHVFSFSIVDSEQIKSQLGSKSQHSEKRWYSSVVSCKKYCFIVVRGKLRTYDTSKMVLLFENSLQFPVVNNFDKKPHFQVCYVMLNLPWLFFQIYIYYRPFFFF